MFGNIRGACVASVSCLAFLCLCGGAVSANNLIINGGFETPPVQAAFNYSYPYSPGSTNITGWVVTGDALSANVTIFGKLYDPTPLDLVFAPKEGNQWLDLTGYKNGKAGVAQTVIVAKNTNYLLTFYVGSTRDVSQSAGIRSRVLVYVNNKLAMVAINRRDTQKTMNWKMFTLTVKSAIRKMKIEFRNGDPSDDGVNGLDAVSLVLAPAAPLGDPAGLFPPTVAPIELNDERINLTPK